MTDFVPCPKCGQIFTVQFEEKTTEEEKSELALLGCNCPAGRQAALIKEQVDEAKLNIEQLCSVNADGDTQPTNVDTIEFLKKSVDLVAEHKIIGLKVKLSGNTNVNISVDSKEAIKVTTTTKTSETLEANKRY